MKKWIQLNKWYVIGAMLGAIAGFVYWKQVGCVDGTCAITSNPWRSTIYFAVLGALAFSMFQSNRKEVVKTNTGNETD